MIANLFIVTILLIIMYTLVVISIRTITYQNTYYLMVLLGLIIVGGMYLFQDEIRDTNEIIGVVGASVLILLSPIVFVFSIYNLFKRSDIPVVISIILTLASAAFLLYMVVAYFVSSVGMIG
jgi:hypothetical protein